MIKFHGLLDGTDGVEQCTVAFLTRFSDDAGRFNADEALFTERGNVFLNGVYAHTNCLANSFVCGMALIRFAVLAVEQVGVDDDFSGR